MKKIKINYLFYNTFVISIFLILIEFLIRIFASANFFDWGLLRLVISSFIISMIFNIIINYLSIKKKRIFNIIFVLFITILNFIQIGLYNYLGFFMGIGNSDQGTKVISYFFDFIKSIKLSYFLIILVGILFLIYYILLEKKIIDKYKFKTNKIYKESIYYIIIISILMIIYNVTIKLDFMKNDFQIQSNYYLWLYPENSNLSVNNFGLNAYLYSDIKKEIFNINDEDVLKYYSYTIGKKDLSNGRILIDDKKWNEINLKTTNETYKLLNNYFINKEVSYKNEMTGIFEGKNVIMILMESINDIAVLNEEYFPNLYYLYNNGISFRNNFSPRNNCSTGNNELSVLTSLYTINNTCTANIYTDNTYFQAAFNMFEDNDYYTSAYHNYSLMYYNRDVYMPKLGVSKYYHADDLGIKVNNVYGDWPEDRLLFENSMKYYMDKDRFFTYFITVSSHQTYNVSSPTGDKYLEKYKELGYSTNISRYLSKVQLLDEGLGVLLKQLRDSNKLDDTVLVLFSDHYPYGLTDDKVNEFLIKNNASYTVERNSIKNKNVDRTPLIIYNPSIEPMIVEKYTSLIDILPTVLNLLNIEYDSRLYMGSDIFSKNHKSKAIFADGSWQDKNAFYYAPSNKITYFGKDKYSNNEIKKINSEINEKQKMSSLILKNNYFNYLENELN